MTKPSEAGRFHTGHSAAARWLGVVLVVGAFAYMLLTLWDSRSEILILFRTADLRWIAVATVCVLAAEAIVATVWTELVSRLASTRRRIAMQAYALSGVARFMPGMIGYAGRAGLAHRYGIELRAAAVASSAETALSFAAAATVATLGASRILAPELDTRQVGLVIGAGLVALVALFPAAMKVAGGSDALRRLSRGTAVASFVGYTLAWSTLGLALIALIRATGSPLDTISPLMGAGIIAGAWAIGLAALVVPGGLGVREAAISAALSPFVGAGPAVIIAFAHRFVWWLALGLMYIVGRVLARHQNSEA